MTKRTTYATTNPFVAVRFADTILQAKVLAYSLGLQQRHRYVPFDDAQTPWWKKNATHFPLTKLPVRAMKTTAQKLKETGTDKGIRPNFTYRGFLRNWKRKNRKALADA